MIKNKGKLALGFFWLAWLVLALLDWRYGHRWPFSLLALIAMLLFNLVSFATREPPASTKPPMRTLPQGPLYPTGVVMFVSVVLALPLWRANWEPDRPMWDGFLAIFLIAMVVGSFLGVRYLQLNHIEFGEARIRRDKPGAG